MGMAEFFAENSCNFPQMWYNRQNYAVANGFSRTGGRNMSETREYITQVQDNGTVQISEEVVATIVLNALTEVEGYAGLSTKPGSDIAELIGKKNWGKGIKVSITEHNELYIDCNICIFYGCSVMAVAKNIQENVASALESSTGVQVLGVNVNVCGIVRK
jgi:uncharacterized alkaline shock family protein YloU